MPRLRPAHGLLILAFALLAFAAGLWVARSTAPLPPPAWLEDWQREVFGPLADGTLDLGQLHSWQEGALWLTRDQQGAQLSYRGTLGTPDGPWRMEAELVLSDEERSSLQKATGIAPGAPDQPLSDAMLEQLRRQVVASVLLAPSQTLSVGRLVASFGPPRLRLQTDGGEAWIYPERGLTLLHRNGELVWLQVVPRESLAH
ncbi:MULTISPECIES: hypothetical protein [Pseudomonas]|jgi:hypothetical protein|uniref:Uncharacterized protein n=1 Tax=Pseudomonas citronellolis TaxID=53408 RepID=A0A127ML45_9PSED|nr:MULTISPECIES: hypothetical protein [Pseudomonas]KSW24621.1 hypothetical protein AOX63_12925 [Pseudomonas sp. ADP]AMO74024.1 hypothetical protein PcP3B5_05160 [Pseudomonas citronellolis]ANI12909.1 hypothetical protein A9C11_02455 [Pseudomonas citronellolis]KES24017.1 hypothetical protein FG99_12720 [Pseudomonas sp. AAC]MDF3844430.1 hypothetical protein [Pseudomonas citronellolis]